MARRRRLNRERVIAQAVTMVNRNGRVQDLSLTALSKALGVRTPSLYNHIAGLEDLRQGMALFALQQLTRDIKEATVGLVGAEALTAIATAYRRFALANPGVYPLTVVAPEPDEEALVALSQELVQTVLLVLASYGVHGDDAIHAIRGLRALLHGFITLESAQGYKLPLDTEESFQRLVVTYLQGLKGNLREAS